MTYNIGTEITISALALSSDSESLAVYAHDIAGTPDEGGALGYIFVVFSADGRIMYPVQAINHYASGSYCPFHVSSAGFLYDDNYDSIYIAANFVGSCTQFASNYEAYPRLLTITASTGALVGIVEN